jgi:hypothetical protein
MVVRTTDLASRHVQIHQLKKNKRTWKEHGYQDLLFLIVLLRTNLVFCLFVFVLRRIEVCARTRNPRYKPGEFPK